MESVELCEIVRDEDEQDGSVSQLIWRVESWESWRSTYLIVIHARLIRFVKLETAGYIPVPVEKKKDFRFHCAYNTIYNFTQWQVGGGTSINNSDSAQRERGWRKTGRVLVRVRISKEAKASTNELIRLVLSENVENHRIHFWLSYCCVLYYSIKKNQSIKRSSNVLLLTA